MFVRGPQLPCQTGHKIASNLQQKAQCGSHTGQSSHCNGSLNGHGGHNNGQCNSLWIQHNGQHNGHKNQCIGQRNGNRTTVCGLSQNSQMPQNRQSASVERHPAVSVDKSMPRKKSISISGHWLAKQKLDVDGVTHTTANGVQADATLREVSCEQINEQIMWRSFLSFAKLECFWDTWMNDWLVFWVTWMNFWYLVCLKWVGEQKKIEQAGEE